MATQPLTSSPVSLTHHIKFHIIRSKAGIDFGSNISDLADPNTITTLGQLIGFAGLDSTKYSAFFGYNLNEVFKDRNILIDNHQEIYLVHNGLLNIPPHLLLQ